MITTWSRGDADHHMPEEILTEFATQVAAHPWWVARSKIILAVLSECGIDPPSRILDAGCGWGQTFEILEARGFRVTGLDIARQALERLDRPGRTLIEADLTQPIDIDPAHRPTFDAVLALDIIEHVDDARALIDRLGSLLEPHGRLLVNVPAMPELFSEFDEANGHRLRYEPGTLRSAFVNTEFTIDRLFYWNAWALPLFRLRRFFRHSAAKFESPLEIYRRHLALPPWPIPWFFDRAFAIEQPWALSGRLGRGTSLMAVARKRETGLENRGSSAGDHGG